MKFILLLVFFQAFLFSNENNFTYKENCSVPDIYLQTILLTENKKKYPYYIRYNNTKDKKTFFEIASNFKYKKLHYYKKDKRTGKKIKIEKKVIDCISSENCQDITYYLVSNGITNIDLGYFQINYRYHKANTELYFDKKKSYKKACSIVEFKTKDKEWNWTTLAYYHSKTKKHNRRYAAIAKKNYKLLLKEKQKKILKLETK